jgi:uncharacterized OsmC-like protein
LEEAFKGEGETVADIKQSLDAAIAYLSSHPEEARYADSPATAVLEENLRFTVNGPDGAAVTTDMPRSVGGTGAAPSPGWLFRAALAGCEATLIAMRAAQAGVSLSRLEVTVDSESDDRGILGISEDVPAGPLSVRIRVTARATTPDADLRSIVEEALSHCPVHDAVVRPVPITVEVDWI